MYRESTMKTICIAGKNNIAVNILLHCIEAYKEFKVICIVNRNETGINTWQKSLEWFAKKCSINIVSLEDTYKINDLFFLSTEFDRIINPDKFKSEDLYNIHFSLLPQYKGCHTSVLPILNGERETGVTLHKIRAGIDTGEIIDQEKVWIEENDNSLDLYEKLIVAGTKIVIKNLTLLLKGQVIFQKQPKEKSTYYSLTAVDYKNLKLDTNKTAWEIKKQVRAFAFRPYQLLGWNGNYYIECDITDEVSKDRPGTVIEEVETYTKISTIDYDIVLYKDVFNRLLEAISSGDNCLAKKLSVSNKVIKSVEKHGWSALTVAVYNNNKLMFDYLIKRGLDIHILNNNGTTLLMYAKDAGIRTGDWAIFYKLLESGLSVDDTDFYGKRLVDYIEDCDMQKIPKEIKKKLYNCTATS